MRRMAAIHSSSPMISPPDTGADSRGSPADGGLSRPLAFSAMGIGEESSSRSAQEAVARHRSGPLLVSGAAASGRSEALVRRFAALADSGLQPHRVLLLTRTRANAAVLRSRVERALDRPH